MGGSDDAGVYRLNDETALVQTVDFLTPVADDPFTFGRIAAANSLSDVYAMGGNPLCALNVVAFPIDDLGVEVLQKMLAGGLEALEEARCTLVGGHSIEDKELKYGLSVTGLVHPDKVLTNTGARGGDALVLTKPLGTGILSTALKAEMAGQEAVEKMYASMMQLNRVAAKLAESFEVHACTDVTGFGLVGHALEMVGGQELTLEIESGALPLLPEVQRWCEMGLLPGGLHRNRCFYERRVEIEASVPQFLRDVIFDPQTSGGLLLSMKLDHVEGYLDAVRGEGIDAAQVGKVIRGGPPGVRLKSLRS